ncbi:MAG: DinB family protein [Candidatus Promineifilaceae bacterium]
MQAPPPVPTLLQQLRTLAIDVQRLSQRENIDWLRQPAEEEWSLAEVMCHLRDVEREVHQVRFRLLIAEENAFLPGVSADEWADERGYCFQDGLRAANSFVAAREETLAMVEPLDEAMWQRQGRHAFFGHTSMHELLYLMVRHDEIHWQQITTLLKLQEGA